MGDEDEDEGCAVELRITEANLTGHEEKVSVENFELLKVLGTGAYGKVFLVRKAGGHDAGKLYAMKVLRKAALVQRAKTQEHTRTERSVLELVRQAPFLVTLHYAFQTDAKLHLILGERTPRPYAGGVAGGRRGHLMGLLPDFPLHLPDYVSGGEMFTHLYQRQYFKEAEVRVYGGEIVLALEHLHKVGEDLATGCCHGNWVWAFRGACMLGSLRLPPGVPGGQVVSGVGTGAASPGPLARSLSVAWWGSPPLAPP
ncbi:Ribosomal protein S6 kinase alpha-4 [Saguinus oedipus]|uniref:Ribosomal protein S6 kinase alpha-4 n=1 Tax=Saguinus oedipus TaxID=9490 RepID=A0ABQ9UTT8_SAGOE|nr:Ribosomal protein S6 kinase alpha-4 [Saguinus oedipus]